METSTAIILCGGKGERLRPVTGDLPKALVPISGVPILQRLMTHLSSSGVSRFVLCTGYRAETIERFAGDAAPSAWQIRCVNSGDVSMTDRILDALPHVTGSALICYGDTLANVDLKAHSECHRASGAAATLTVYPLRSAFGIVEFDVRGRVTAMTEKPHLPYWINIGYLRCEPEAFLHMKRGADLVEFCRGLAAAGRLCVYQHLGSHMTVNTERELMEAEAEMTKFATVEH